MDSSNLYKAAPLGALLFFSSLLGAATWVPADNNAHILSLKTQINTPQAITLAQADYRRTRNQSFPVQLNAGLELAENYLHYAIKPGMSHFQLKASRLASQLEQAYRNQQSSFDERQKSRLFLVKARLLAYKHHFEQALEWLSKVPQNQPKYAQAQLTYSRLASLIGKSREAGKACTRLIGKAELYISQLCLFDQQLSRGEKLSPTLVTQLDRLQSNADKTGEVSRWLALLKGEQAMLENNPSLAAQYFGVQLDDADTSQWLLWADALLEAKAPQQVLQKLAPLAQKLTLQNQTLQDNLLLRLARAEKMLDQSKHWQQSVEQRMALRELRQDQQHAADLAYYYLHLSQTPQKAKRWAQLNWEQVKEPSDRRLLNRALALEVPYE